MYSFFHFIINAKKQTNANYDTELKCQTEY